MFGFPPRLLCPKLLSVRVARAWPEEAVVEPQSEVVVWPGEALAVDQVVDPRLEPRPRSRPAGRP